MTDITEYNKDSYEVVTSSLEHWKRAKSSDDNLIGSVKLTKTVKKKNTKGEVREVQQVYAKVTLYAVKTKMLYEGVYFIVEAVGAEQKSAKGKDYPIRFYLKPLYEGLARKNKDEAGGVISDHIDGPFVDRLVIALDSDDKIVPYGSERYTFAEFLYHAEPSVVRVIVASLLPEERRFVVSTVSVAEEIAKWISELEPSKEKVEVNALRAQQEKDKKKIRELTKKLAAAYESKSKKVKNSEKVQEGQADKSVETAQSEQVDETAKKAELATPPAVKPKIKRTRKQRVISSDSTDAQNG